MHTFDYFVSFILSVWDHVFTLLAGCVVTVVINLIEKYLLKGKRLSAKVDIAILLIFLFFACFQAWQDQYKATNESTQLLTDANRKLTELTVPNLRGELEMPITAPAGDRKESSMLNISATIFNTGAPSIARDFKFEIHLADGTVRRAEILPSPGVDNKLILHFSSGQTLEESGADYLPRRGVVEPIPRGGATGGFCELFFPNVPIETLDRANIYMSFADITGKRYSANLALTGSPKTAMPDIHKLQGWHDKR